MLQISLILFIYRFLFKKKDVSFLYKFGEMILRSFISTTKNRSMKTLVATYILISVAGVSDFRLTIWQKSFICVSWFWTFFEQTFWTRICWFLPLDYVVLIRHNWKKLKIEKYKTIGKVPFEDIYNQLSRLYSAGRTF